PLRILAGFVGRRIRKHLDTMVALDDADMAAHVARQPCMRGRMDVPGAHTIAGLELRGRLRIAPELAAHHDALDVGSGELAALQRLGRRRCVPFGDLILSDKALGDQHVLEPEQPLLVVGARQIDMRGQGLAVEARSIDVEGAGRAHGPHHRQHAAFPPRMEHRLVRLDLDLAETIHAAHVVHAVHDGTPGVFGKPVPIMLSRVTSSASFSSLQPSVPLGRIGSTRKRVSAVESQTRISVSFGRLTPKSVNTPRGSLTARERYGAALYQTGGSPSISQG